MKRVLKTLQSSVLILFAFTSGPLQAESSEPSTEIGIYGFMSALNGTTTLGNVTADIDVPFEDLLENLKFGVMGFANHRRGKWSFIGDLYYANIGTQGNIASSPILSVSVDTSIKQLWASAYVGYQIYEQKVGDRSLNIDVLGGLRYNSLDISLDARANVLGLVTAASRQRDEDWIDGVIGVRGSYDFGNGWAANGWLDAGLGKDSSSYQVIATTSYTFSNNIKVYGGFRAYNIDYSTNTGPVFFAIDQTSLGPILGASYKF